MWTLDVWIVNSTDIYFIEGSEYIISNDHVNPMGNIYMGMPIKFLLWI